MGVWELMIFSNGFHGNHLIHRQNGDFLNFDGVESKGSRSVVRTEKVG